MKLFFPEGEIDFVASTTLTNNPFEINEVLSRNIYLETPVEIVTKIIEAFTNQYESRKSIMQPVFNEIEKIEFELSFDDCLLVVNELKNELLTKLLMTYCLKIFVF